MNKKAQMGMGGIILLFIGIIVAFALLPSIANGVDTMVSTREAVNVSYTLPAAGARIDLAGSEYISDVRIINQTGLQEVSSTNYTIDEIVSASGGKTISLLVSAGADYASDPVNISYVYGADGYADNAGTRGIANTIVIFSALGLLGFVVYYAIGKAGWLK